MRIRTHGVATAATLALMSACAGAATQARPDAAADTELSALRAQQQAQTRRIAELEARLSLIEADARRARTGDETPLRTGDSVRIGAANLTSTESEARPASAAEEEIETGKRPSLRLYGNASVSAGSSAQRAALPAVPQVTERLPVVPLPEQRAAKALRASTPAANAEGAVEQYRKGLRSLQDRRWDEALAQFGAFVAEHPRHELVASALYWRGEALYAKRDYAAASKELESLLERFPSTPRAPDALLKLGLSLQKLGSKSEADAAFQRLRTDYPNSQAAEAAAREGST